jgi:hypothetical protein
MGSLIQWLILVVLFKPLPAHPKDLQEI